MGTTEKDMAARFGLGSEVWNREWALYLQERDKIFGNIEARLGLGSSLTGAGVLPNDSSSQSMIDLTMGQVYQEDFADRAAALGGHANYNELIGAANFYGIPNPDKIPPLVLAELVQEYRLRMPKDVNAEGDYASAVLGSILTEPLHSLVKVAQRIPFAGDWLAKRKTIQEADQFLSMVNEGLSADLPEDLLRGYNVSKGIFGMVGYTFPAVAAWKVAGAAGSIPVLARYGSSLPAFARAGIQGAASAWLLEGGGDSPVFPAANTIQRAFDGDREAWLEMMMGNRAGIIATGGLAGMAFHALGTALPSVLGRVRKSMSTQLVAPEPVPPGWQGPDWEIDPTWGPQDQANQLARRMLASGPDVPPPDGPGGGGGGGGDPMPPAGPTAASTAEAASIRARLSQLRTQMNEGMPMTDEVISELDALNRRLRTVEGGTSTQMPVAPNAVRSNPTQQPPPPPPDDFGGGSGGALVRRPPPPPAPSGVDLSTVRSTPAGLPPIVAPRALLAAPEPERVISAAIQMPDGQVFRGALHGEAATAAEEAGYPMSDIVQALSGFETNKGRLLSHADSERMFRQEPVLGEPLKLIRLNPGEAVTEAITLSHHSTLMESPAIAEMAGQPTFDVADVVHAAMASHPGQINLIRNVGDVAQVVGKLTRQQAGKTLSPSQFRVVEREVPVAARFTEVIPATSRPFKNPAYTNEWIVSRNTIPPHDNPNYAPQLPWRTTIFNENGTPVIHITFNSYEEAAAYAAKQSGVPQPVEVGTQKQYDILVSDGLPITNKRVQQYKDFGLFEGQKAVTQFGNNVIVKEPGPETTLVYSPLSKQEYILYTKEIHPGETSWGGEEVLGSDANKMYESLKKRAVDSLNKEMADAGLPQVGWLDQPTATQLPRLVEEFLDAQAITNPVTRNAFYNYIDQRRVQEFRSYAPPEDLALADTVEDAIAQVEEQGLPTSLNEIAAAKGLRYQLLSEGADEATTGSGINLAQLEPMGTVEGKGDVYNMLFDTPQGQARAEATVVPFEGGHALFVDALWPKDRGIYVHEQSPLSIGPRQIFEAAKLLFDTFAARGQPLNNILGKHITGAQATRPLNDDHWLPQNWTGGEMLKGELFNMRIPASRFAPKSKPTVFEVTDVHSDLAVQLDSEEAVLEFVRNFNRELPDLTPVSDVPMEVMGDVPASLGTALDDVTVDAMDMETSIDRAFADIEDFVQQLDEAALEADPVAWPEGNGWLEDTFPLEGNVRARHYPKLPDLEFTKLNLKDEYDFNGKTASQYTFEVDAPEGTIQGEFTITPLHDRVSLYIDLVAPGELTPEGNVSLFSVYKEPVPVGSKAVLEAARILYRKLKKMGIEIDEITGTHVTGTWRNSNKELPPGGNNIRIPKNQLTRGEPSQRKRRGVARPGWEEGRSPLEGGTRGRHISNPFRRAVAAPKNLTDRQVIAAHLDLAEQDPNLAQGFDFQITDETWTPFIAELERRFIAKQSPDLGGALDWHAAVESLGNAYVAVANASTSILTPEEIVSVLAGRRLDFGSENNKLIVQQGINDGQHKLQMAMHARELKREMRDVRRETGVTDIQTRRRANVSNRRPGWEADQFVLHGGQRSRHNTGGQRKFPPANKQVTQNPPPRGAAPIPPVPPTMHSPIFGPNPGPAATTFGQQVDAARRSGQGGAAAVQAAERIHDSLVAEFLHPTRTVMINAERYWQSIGITEGRTWKWYNQISTATNKMHNAAFPYYEEIDKIISPFRRVLRRQSVVDIQMLPTQQDRANAMARRGYTRMEQASQSLVNPYVDALVGQHGAGELAFQYLRETRNRIAQSVIDPFEDTAGTLNGPISTFADFARYSMVNPNSTDIGRLLANYTRAVMWHRHVAPDWQVMATAVYEMRGGAVRPPAGGWNPSYLLPRDIFEPLDEFLQIARTGHNPGRDAVVKGISSIFNMIDPSISERDVRAIMRGGITAGYRGMVGGKPYTVFRDTMNPLLTGVRIGFEPVMSAYKSWLRGGPTVRDQMRQRAYDGGWLVQGMPQIPDAEMFGRPDMTPQGIVIQQPGVLKAGVNAVADAAYGLVPQGLRGGIQGTNIDPLKPMTALGEFNRMISGEAGYQYARGYIDEYLAGRMTLDELMDSPAVRVWPTPIQHNFFELMSQRRDVDAAYVIANEAANYQMRYGTMESPRGLRSTTGKLAQQLGTFSIQHIRQMGEFLTQGTGADRAAAMVRYGAVAGMLYVASKATGMNFNKWMWPASFIYVGGPLAEQAVTAWQAAFGAAAEITPGMDPSFPEKAAMQSFDPLGSAANYLNPYAGAMRTARDINHNRVYANSPRGWIQTLLTGDKGVPFDFNNYLIKNAMQGTGGAPAAIPAETQQLTPEQQVLMMRQQRVNVGSGAQ